MYLIIAIVIILIIYFIYVYNGLVKLKKNVDQTFSGIDVYLKQRFDLIPNLVECVKGYTQHEKETFERITELRALYNEKSDIGTVNELNKEIDNIVLTIEANPDLKASEQYLKLQKTLIKVESQIQASRRLYNNEVRKYNYAIEAFPSNIVALMIGYKEKEYFTIIEEEKNNVEVKM